MDVRSRPVGGQVRSPMPFRLVDYWTMTRTRGLDDFVTTPRRLRNTATP